MKRKNDLSYFISLQKDELKELNVHNALETYEGITKADKWVAGITLGVAFLSLGTAYCHFDANLSKASAARQWSLNKVSPPGYTANLDDWKIYMRSKQYETAKKYLQEDGSIKLMTTFEKLGYALKENGQYMIIAAMVPIAYRGAIAVKSESQNPEKG